MSTESSAWIYKLNKSELQNKLRELGVAFDSNATVENLRKILRTQCKKPKIKTPKMTNYQLQPFDGENWYCFEQQLECIITLNEVAEEKKVPLLLTKLTTKVLDVLNTLCTPEITTKLTYAVLCEKLKKKYTKIQPTPLDRATFRSRNQLPTESVEDYVLQLKKLGARCNFKDLDDQIKEKLIDGAHSRLVKFELLKCKSDISLEEMINLARTVETALIQTNEVKKENSISDTSDMFLYEQRKTEGRKPVTNKNTNRFNRESKPNSYYKREQICYCCGASNHTKAQCRLQKKFCSECGGQGHIFKMCSQNKRASTRVYNIKKNETSSESEQEDVEIPGCECRICKEYEMNTIKVGRIPPHYITLKIEGLDLDFQLDTGSDVTVIPLKDKTKFFNNKNVTKCNVKFKNFDQSISQPVGILENLTVQYEQKEHKLNVFIGNCNMPRILGRDWLSVFGLWPPNFLSTNVIKVDNNKSVSEAVNQVKEKFAEVFSPGWGNFKGETIKLKLKPDAKPKCYPVRRVPLALKEKVKLEILRLVENKRIKPVEYSQWGTPVVPILKADGSVRLCGDYKVTVNPHLEIDHFPLPHIEEIFETLKNGEYFCELDLKEAYLQAPLDEKSQELTTIVTEAGTYQYQYLPYGMNTGPGSFQRLMYAKLSNIPNTIVFIDNIYIVGKSVNETLDTLCKVLSKLKDCEFKLKLEKCKFFQKSINVFGFKITKNEISVKKENIEPLLKAEPPKNITLLKSFLGKVNYYARFLKNMAHTLTPLYECTQKNKFQWTRECDDAFKSIKEKLTSLDNLRHYNPDLPLILTCDASHTALGVVLSNRDRNGVVQPIAYASRKLNATEQKYSAIDKEALAIIFGVTKFYNYTYGHCFELETDNAALVRIFGPTKGIPKMAAKRLQHYAIFLSAFTYKIRHIKTSLNPADFLSRAQLDCNQNEITLHPICKNANVSNIHYINNSEIEKLDWKAIQSETKIDTVLSTIIRYTVDGWPEKKLLNKELLTYYHKKNELSVDRGCLFWGFRIVVPTILRQTVLIELHKSHFGTVRMKQLARSYFWWPNLDTEIENITSSCITCLSNHKNPQKGKLKQWPAPQSVWYRLHADFLGPFYNKMYLVVIDSYSKWPEVYEMSNIGAKQTIEKFKCIFSRFGFPALLVTDNGPTFTSSEFENYCKAINVKHTFSPPYHPATNGAAERFVETFKSHVTKIKESGNLVSSAINLFLFDYRNMPHNATGVTPARLLLGRELRNRFSLFRPPAIIEKSYEMLEKQCKNSSGNRSVEFNVGEKVMVKDYRKGGKPWIEGVIIRESVPNTTYIIDVNGGQWKRHVNQMLKCNVCLNE